MNVSRAPAQPTVRSKTGDDIDSNTRIPMRQRRCNNTVDAAAATSTTVTAAAAAAAAAVDVAVSCVCVHRCQKRRSSKTCSVIDVATTVKDYNVF
jgi:hypothetical protein